MTPTREQLYMACIQELSSAFKDLSKILATKKLDMDDKKEIDRINNKAFHATQHLVQVIANEQLKGKING
jgi:hypothetical protein